MKSSNKFLTFRRYATVLAAAIGVGGIWGFIAAVGVRITFDVSETYALLYFGLPIGAVVAALMWRRLPRMLGF